MVRMMPQCFYLFHLQFVQVIVKSFQHAIEGSLCGIGNKRKDSMFHIIIHCFQNRIYQLLPQLLAFTVNAGITSPAEVNTFERTRLHFFRLVDLHQTHFPFFVDQQGLPWLQLIDRIHRDV